MIYRGREWGAVSENVTCVKMGGWVVVMGLERRGKNREYRNTFMTMEDVPTKMVMLVRAPKHILVVYASCAHAIV